MEVKINEKTAAVLKTVKTIGKKNGLTDEEAFAVYSLYCKDTSDLTNPVNKAMFETLCKTYMECGLRFLLHNPINEYIIEN